MPTQGKLPKRVPKAQVKAAVEALDGVRREWLRRPGVTAVDVGYKIKGNQLTDELAVRMHVERKKPPESVEAFDLATSPKKPQKCGDFSIDVLEATYEPGEGLGAELVEAAEAVDRRSRVDPLIAGISVANRRVTAGTLGAIVWDRGDGKACILSNWHVLCGDPACAPGEDILQPGRLDGGGVGDKVAELKRFRLDADADAAIAQLTGEREFSRDVLGLDPIPGVAAPALGMRVSKSGRTTAVTEGLIDGVSLTTTLTYRSGPVQTFNNQIHIVPRPGSPPGFEVSLGGDSGSVWVDDASHRAVGLHFAGEVGAAPEHAVANRMEAVAQALNISFTPVFRPPPPVDDSRLRELIRRILCARFPWLCGGGFPFAGPQAAAPRAGCSCGGQEAAATGTFANPAGGPGVEALVEEILAEMRNLR